MFPSRRQNLAALLLLGLFVTALAAKSWSLARIPVGPYAKPGTGCVVFRTLAGATDFASGTLDRARTDETGALILDTAGGLEAGTDSAGQYNGGDFLFGTYLSPAWDTGAAVDSVVASWSADTPDGTWLRVDARALQGGVWTRYYTVGVWASGTSVLSRRNGGPQEDENGLVDTDALTLKRSASAVQLRVTLFTADPGLTPRLRRLSVVATGPAPAEGAAGTARMSGDAVVSPLWMPAWGTDLAVPERRQNDFPDGGGWCSPASVSMLLAFWAGRAGNDAWDRTVPEVAAGVTDHEYGGTGNWVFNTAYAASLGLDTYVTRFVSLAGVERWIAAGVPVAINIEFGTGELDGAPMPSSDGHIIVIRGFDRKGDPITNDPAARADQREKVRIVYDREQLERAWLGRPTGTAYIILPPGYPTPSW